MIHEDVIKFGQALFENSLKFQSNAAMIIKK